MTIIWCLVILFYATDMSSAHCSNKTCTSCTEESCPKCKDGYYLSSDTDPCLQCHYMCRNCTAGVTCISCASEECDLCTNNCTTDMCYNENCTECIDGFYLYNGQCFRCLNLGCTCDEISGCNECLPGWHGNSCETPCPEQCKNKVCDKNTGSCTEGCSPGIYGSCENTCPSFCLNGVCDANTGICTSGCEADHNISVDTCSKCLKNCINCTSPKSCSKCKDGFYVKSGECAGCRPRCKMCSDYETCSVCRQKYYWGDRCEYDCVGCMSQCNKTHGCSNGCDPFYYQTEIGIKGAIKCTRCPNDNQCLACTNGSYCNACAVGFWGTICQSACKGCDAEDCDKDTGCHIYCADGYSLIKTNTEAYCIPCPDYCEKCASNTTCQICKNGFYSFTNDTCSNCSENCKYGAVCNSQTGACPDECINGWWGEKCDMRCPKTCVTCEQTRSDHCSTCHQGYYGNKCEYNCSAHCVFSDGEQICDSKTGTCSDGCVTGWWGEKCDMECPTTCVACEQMRSGNCSTCRQGYYGNKCENNCSNHCIISGDKQICEKENGACIQGCQNFFWGHNCKNSCNVGCKGSVCNATSGFCINGCADSFYDISCNKTCSEFCQLLETNSSKRRCDSESGHCLHSCRAGWYGTFCSNKCEGHCNGSVCNQSGGKCTFGCEKGYTGDNCYEEQVSGTPSPKEEGNNATVIGAAAGAGAALVIFGAIIVFVFILRRRRRAGQDDTSKQSLSLEATTSETTDEPTYSRIEKKRSLKTDGSIALKDTAEDNKTDALTNQACQDTLKFVKRASRFRKQSQEEDASQVSREEEMLEETEFAGKSESNTYYNTTGRRIPLDKLADYVEHKAVQHIENEFHKLPKGLSTEKEYTVARRQNNILKNRYKFIYPYDESRVVLRDGGNDYINASYVEGFNRDREYIGAMGPFEKCDVDIVPDFWRMIWQEQCETIVMLTKLVENRQTKCKQYWPDPGNSEAYGDLHMTCMSEDVYADFIVRSFTITKDGETLHVRHLHFTAWPDKTVPDDVTCLIEFRQKVRSLHKEKTCPMIVHCSAGIGRTGTFIALDILTFEGEARGYIDIFGCVATIRSQRVNLVQTPAQYVYLHHSVVHSLTFNCQAIQGDMFIEHYRKLNEKTDGRTAIEKQYEKLQSSFPEQSLEESSLIQNKKLANKIRNGADADLLGDGYRVILRENRKPGASDFINAIFVNGFRTRRKFIVAQTPLPATVVDFLSMVIQEKCSCIVMMDEPNLQDKTIGVYWPADNQAIKHGVFEVSCVESESSPNFTVKKLVITYHGQDKETTHDVHLFMFTAWPKESITPKTPESVLELIKVVDVHARGSANKGPIIVHCMTGSQRSCLYCAVSVLIEKMEIEHEVSVVNTLRQIKARRRSAIPSLGQYKFCHQAIVSYLQSFDIYSNFGLRASQAVVLKAPAYDAYGTIQR